MTAPVLVNSWESSQARAIPKSVTFTVPSVARRMFPGLTSRCTRPARWAAARAEATSAPISAARRGSRAPSLRRTSRRLRPSTKFHDDEVGVAGLAPVVDPDDVGVGEVGGGLGLSPEPLDEGFVVGELGVEDLDRHLPTKQGVLAQIDVGHPAAGQMRREVITLGKGVGKVHGEPTEILGDGSLHSPAPPTGRPGFISSAIPLITRAAMGAATEPPLALSPTSPPDSTNTATAIEGCSTGPNPMNQACGRPSSPVAVPVFPATLMPGTAARRPVPSVTTRSIIWLMTTAVSAENAWVAGPGLGDLDLRSLRVEGPRDQIRRSGTDPWLATAAATSAICNGVALTSRSPMPLWPRAAWSRLRSGGRKRRLGDRPGERDFRC